MPDHTLEVAAGLYQWNPLYVLSSPLGWGSDFVGKVTNSCICIEDVAHMMDRRMFWEPAVAKHTSSNTGFKLSGELMVLLWDCPPAVTNNDELADKSNHTENRASPIKLVSLLLCLFYSEKETVWRRQIGQKRKLQGKKAFSSLITTYFNMLKHADIYWCHLILTHNAPLCNNKCDNSEVHYSPNSLENKPFSLQPY